MNTQKPISFIKEYFKIPTSNKVVSITFTDNAPEALINRLNKYNVCYNLYKISVECLQDIVQKYDNEHKTLSLYVNFVNNGVWYSTFKPKTKKHSNDMRSVLTSFYTHEVDIMNKFKVSKTKDDERSVYSRNSLEKILMYEVESKLPYYAYPCNHVTYGYRYLQQHLPFEMRDRDRLLTMCLFSMTETIAEKLYNTECFKLLECLNKRDSFVIRLHIDAINKLHNDDPNNEDNQIKVNVMFIKFVQVLKSNGLI